MINALLITSRADIGGGPKVVNELARIIGQQYPEINLYIASPEGHHFSSIYKKNSKAFFAIPHRKFCPVRLFLLLLFCIKNRIHVIHSHGRGAGYYSRPLGLFYKVIHTFHGVHQPKNRTEQLKMMIDRLFKHMTHKFTCCSLMEFKNAVAYGITTKAKTETIANGLEIDAYAHCTDHCDTIKKLNLPDDSYIIGTLTRFDQQKGNDLLINHFSHLCQKEEFNKVILIIAGDGEEHDKIHALVDELGLKKRIFFLGNISEVVPFLHSIDLFVSSSRGEGLPVSVLEAMACGTPCILSSVSGHIDILPETYLFDLNDNEEFRLKVQKLLEITPNGLNELKITLQNRVREDYNLDQVTAQVVDLYKGH